jgi:penicillin-binding protein 1C
MYTSIWQISPPTTWGNRLSNALDFHEEGMWFYDRNHQLINVIQNQENARILPMSFDQISPHLINALVCLEDQSFYEHFGVPLRGVLRASWINLKAGRFMAGGSGITQQVIKMFRGRSRGLSSKIKEAQYAIWLDHAFSKKQIIATYLNYAHYGSNLVGVWQATQQYFATDPNRLSLAQAAYIASLPHAPTRFSPRKDLTRAIPRQRAALQCLRQQNMIDENEYARAIDEPITLSTSPSSLSALHLTESIVFGELTSTIHAPWQPIKTTNKVQLTIDATLQNTVQNIVEKYAQVHESQGLRQVAVVGLSVKTGEALFWVGSRDYHHHDAGQVDHILGQRLPGSTLKPFLYGLALDKGFELDSLLPDRPIYFKTPRGQYRPQNYDHKHRGKVPLMSSLAMSLNVPSVWLLNQCGIEPFLQQLRVAGLHTLDQDALHYGLGLSLGDGDVRLIDLVNAYRGLAHNGRSSPWQVIMGSGTDNDSLTDQNSSRFMSARAAQAILQVLSNRTLRAPSFGKESALNLPFPAAVKTGTSQGYSNAWTIGLSSEIAVGVWVLPHTGAKLSGAMIAAPLWQELMLYFHRSKSTKAFRTDALRANDKRTLASLMVLENSTHQASYSPRGSTHLNQHNSVDMPMQMKLNTIPKIKLLTPPQGAVYNYLPQRNKHDNQLRAEVRLNGLSKKSLIHDEEYSIAWYWNGSIINVNSPHELSIWIDPWKSPLSNQTLCVELWRALTPKPIRVQRNCTAFKVNHPPFYE